jgi:hypothetical protein
MTAFSDLPWHIRRGELDKTTRKAFAKVRPEAVPYGYNGAPFSISHQPATLRYTPDMVDPDGLWELIGVGRAQVAKFKVEKLEALLAWPNIGPLRLFAYDSYRTRYWEMEVGPWRDACHASDIERFPDSKRPYYAVPVSRFPAEPVSLRSVNADA